MRGRTRILVTHALHLTLPCADYVVALVNGYVAFEGPAEGYVGASGANTPGIAPGLDFSMLTLKPQSTPAAEKPPYSATELSQAMAQATAEAFPDLDMNPLSTEPLLTQAEKQSVGKC